MVIYMSIEFYILNYAHANVGFIWYIIGYSDIGMLSDVYVGYGLFTYVVAFE